MFADYSIQTNCIPNMIIYGKNNLLIKIKSYGLCLKANPLLHLIKVRKPGQINEAGFCCCNMRVLL